MRREPDWDAPDPHGEWAVAQATPDGWTWTVKGGVTVATGRRPPAPGGGGWTEDRRAAARPVPRVVREQKPAPGGLTSRPPTWRYGQIVVIYIPPPRHAEPPLVQLGRSDRFSE